MEGFIEHEFADVFGVAVAVWKDGVDGHAFFGYVRRFGPEWVVANGGDRRDEFEMDFGFVWTSTRDIACQIDHVPHDCKLGFEAFYRHFGAHKPSVVNDASNDFAQLFVFIVL